MPEVALKTGVRVSFPDTLQLTEVPPVTLSPGRRRMPIPSGPVPVKPAGVASGFSGDLLEALSAQDLHVLQHIELQPRPVIANSFQVRAAPLLSSASQSVAIDADVAESEDAVVLTEQDGMYAWHIHRAATSAPTSTMLRSLNAAKTLRFDVDLYLPDSAPLPGSRNFLTDLAVGGIRAWVLKFAARSAAEEAVQYLERNTRTGFIFIKGHDPEAWRFEAAPTPLSVPSGRVGRVLLLIHGTFSSTIGSFGVLTGTPWGQQFLTAAEADYDAVIGFDHSTLRETPRENAASLLQLLERFLPKETQIDVITHSRGGLVFRSLTELVLPSSKWQANIGRVVMVASPNAGTLLAEPANWNSLVDLYTNLAVGACRLLALMPQATAVPGILKELFHSVGEFLKYLAQDAAGAGGVPGLDAMRPSGDFVKHLNETQPGQPAPGAISLYAITSEFAPSLSGPDTEPKELPKRLLLMSTGALMNQLMKEPNDLVVNADSMTAVDIAAGDFITDQFRFGATGAVYHTTYFIRPETINAIVRWLRLPPPVASPQATEARSRTLPVAGADVPALVDTDISLLDSVDLSGGAIACLKALSPSFTVVRRTATTKTFYYAYKTEELLDSLKSRDPLTSLTDALGLDESKESPQFTVSTVSRVQGDPKIETTTRGVILIDDLPVGVVPAVSDFTPSLTLPGIAHSITAPLTAGSPLPGVVRRTMPTFGPVRVMRGGAPTRVPIAQPTIISAPPPSPPPPPSPVLVQLRFQAEMPCEVQVDKECSVAVTISRESIAAASGTLSASGEGAADETRKLLIQIIPRAQFSIEDDRQRVDVPPAGKPATYYFDLKATHVGDGEILVVIRQERSPISTLILKPKIVNSPAMAGRRLHAETESDSAPERDAPLHQLRIMDLRNGGEIRYRFEISSPTLSLLQEYESKAMNEVVSAYVNRLYADIEKRWLTTKGDREDFAAEMLAFGADLFNSLIPPDLQKVLWEHRNNIESIMVISTEPFIPWEMVLVKDPDARGLGKDSRFLAEMGLVRWLYDAGWPPIQIQIREGRARYVIPQYPMQEYVLPEALQEADGLKHLFGATSVEPQPTAVRDLLSEGSFDLLHFACHAGAEGDDVSDGRILLQGRIEGTGRDAKYIPATIDAKLVSLFANLTESDGSRPVIVLNACQSGRAGYRLSSMGGFAQSFLSKGAAAFVGALWSVGDQPARTFTEEFYAQLLTRTPVAKAAGIARQKAKGAGDATWLAYVIYAHPNATLFSK